jgi:hypothetical protein
MTTREAMGYFVQLRDLYTVRFATGHKPRARYRRVSQLELREMEQTLRGRDRA